MSILATDLFNRIKALTYTPEFHKRNKAFDQVTGDYSGYQYTFFLKNHKFISDTKIKVEYPNGGWKKYEYDHNNNNNIIKVEYSNGGRKKYEYDDHNNIIKKEAVAESLGMWCTCAYDVNNNLIKEEYTHQLLTAAEYNAKGDKINKERSNVYWRKYEYDTDDNLINVESSTGYGRKFEYDDHSNII